MLRRGIGDRRSLALRAWPQSSALCSEAQPSSGQEKGKLSESCCPTQRLKDKRVEYSNYFKCFVNSMGFIIHK